MKSMCHNPVVKLLPLYFLIFISFFGYSMMITAFTPMMIYASYWTLEQRVFWLGILLGVYSIGQIIGTPLVLKLVSYLGQKRTFITSLLVTALGYLWIAYILYLDKENILALSVGVFVTGFAESNVSLADQVVIHTALHTHRSHWIGYVEACKSLAFFLGPPFVGLLSLNHPSFPFWTMLVLLIITTLWLSYWLPSIRPKQTTSTFLKTLKNLPKYQFIVNFLAYFAIFGFFRAYPMDLADRFEINILSLSLYIMWVAVPMLLVTLILNRYALQKFAARKLASMGMCICGFFTILLPYINSIGALMIADLFLIGLGIGFCLPNATIVIAKSVSINRREQAIEIDETFQLGSEALSSLVGGLCGIVLIQLPLLVFGFSALASALLLGKKELLLFINKTKK